jgi:hypothetical protein
MTTDPDTLALAAALRAAADTLLTKHTYGARLAALASVEAVQRRLRRRLGLDVVSDTGDGMSADVTGPDVA